MNTSRIETLAAAWSAKHPDLAARIGRAKGLVGRVTATTLDTMFLVKGETATYIVLVDRAARSSTCTCPDHVRAGHKCKHVLAVALYEKSRLKIRGRG